MLMNFTIDGGMCPAVTSRLGGHREWVIGMKTMRHQLKTDGSDLSWQLMMYRSMSRGAGTCPISTVATLLILLPPSSKQYRLLKSCLLEQLHKPNYTNHAFKRH